VLQDHGYEEIFSINKARVPVVKFVDPFIQVGGSSSSSNPPARPELTSLMLMKGGNARVQCDIVINNTVAVHNTQMIATYCAIDTRCKALIFLVKVSSVVVVYLW